MGRAGPGKALKRFSPSLPFAARVLWWSLPPWLDAGSSAQACASQASLGFHATETTGAPGLYFWTASRRASLWARTISAASAALICEPVPGGALDEGQVGDFSSDAGAEAARTCVEAADIGPIMTRLHTIAAAVAKSFGFIEHPHADCNAGENAEMPDLAELGLEFSAHRAQLNARRTMRSPSPIRRNVARLAIARLLHSGEFTGCGCDQRISVNDACLGFTPIDPTSAAPPHQQRRRPLRLPLPRAPACALTAGAAVNSRSVPRSRPRCPADSPAQAQNRHAASSARILDVWPRGTRSPAGNQH